MIKIQFVYKTIYMYNNYFNYSTYEKSIFFKQMKSIFHQEI